MATKTQELPASSLKAGNLSDCFCLQGSEKSLILSLIPQAYVENLQTYQFLPACVYNWLVHTTRTLFKEQGTSRLN